MGTLRISQLAERTGVPATTLRYYESAGLLSADRTPSGYRVYGDAAVERLEFIGSAKHLGLPLEEIAELLDVWDSATCADVKADLRPRIEARIDATERRTAELAAFTRTLRRALAHLDALPDRRVQCDAECLIHEELPDPPVERWREAPIACSLDGSEFGERAEQWRELVAGAGRDEIPEGIQLTLPAAKAAAVAELAAAEQSCCPFFDFSMRFDGPLLRLAVRAPAGAADALALFS